MTTQGSNTQQSLAGLFKQQGGSIGLDDKSSSIVIANLGGGVMPMCTGRAFTPDEEETDDFRIIFFGIDKSGSMEPVEAEVSEGFDEIVLPGLLGGAAPQVGAIRYGGLQFGRDIQPLWNGGFLPLEKSFPRLSGNYRATDGCTRLFDGALDCMTAATAYALQVQAKTGTPPEVIIALLSDGANNAGSGSAQKVYDVASKLSKELFTLVFLGFETGESVDFRSIAQSMGFGDVQEFKAQPGETKEQQQRRMRHALKTFSDNVVKRASTSQVGQNVSASAAAGSGFWQS